LAFSPNYLIIDHEGCDDALATWLARRLTLEGYLVWCRSTAPIAGASLHETIEALLNQRAFRFLTILSPAAIANPDMAARRATALAISTKGRRDLLIPIVAAPFEEQALDARTRQLESLRFDESRQTGLDKLLKSLEAVHCPRTEDGVQIALHAFIPEDVISTKPEKLLSDRFPVLKVPEVIHRFTASKVLIRIRSLVWGCLGLFVG
jgi:TIR domain